MPATSPQPVPSQQYGIPPTRARGASGVPRAPCLGRFWSEGILWSVAQGCSSGDAQFTLYRGTAHPGVPKPGGVVCVLQDLQQGCQGWPDNGGGGECRVLSGHLALAGGILGRSLAGSLSGCCSTPKTLEGPSWSGRVRPRKVSGAGGSQLGGPPPGLGEHLCRGLFVHASQSWFPQLKCTGREKNRIIPCS